MRWCCRRRLRPTTTAVCRLCWSSCARAMQGVAVVVSGSFCQHTSTFWHLCVIALCYFTKHNSQQSAHVTLSARTCSAIRTLQRAS